ncbi:hypothetical protein GQX74_003801 [Glossina fuscipes]|nr:hypothetical protein GQX74_003801 [Glossina fuscipes]
MPVKKLKLDITSEINVLNSVVPAATSDNQPEMTDLKLPSPRDSATVIQTPLMNLYDSDVSGYECIRQQCQPSMRLKRTIEHYSIRKMTTNHTCINNDQGTIYKMTTNRTNTIYKMTTNHTCINYDQNIMSKRHTRYCNVAATQLADGHQL